jgi:enterochelin esterase-like enzyme
LQAELRREPYRGLVFVTPYTPDVYVGNHYDDLPGYADWVAGVIVPRARAELPVLTTREATGVDGVSMGGFVALMVGLQHPETFGVVGALLPAVRTTGSAVVAAYGSSSPSPSSSPPPGRPAQQIRLVTSDGDYLRADIERLSREMHAHGIAHELVELIGGHDYEFSRGTGGIEMLMFHDRVQRGEPAP